MYIYIRVTNPEDDISHSFMHISFFRILLSHISVCETSHCFCPCVALVIWAKMAPFSVIIVFMYVDQQQLLAIMV